MGYLCSRLPSQFVESRFPDVISKIWMALTAYRAAKEITVDTDGVGEDLPFSMLGWCSDRHAVTCRFSDQLMRQQKARYEGVVATADAMRRIWACDEITLLTEGFCLTAGGTFDPTKTMAKQFADGNEHVMECLAVTHASADHLTIVAQPYKYLLGRKVAFGELVHYPINEQAYSGYPGELMDALGQVEPEPLPFDTEMFFLRNAQPLEQRGINVFWR